MTGDEAIDKALILTTRNAHMRDAQTFADHSIQSLHLMNKAIHGWGYPWSGDAHTITAAKETTNETR